MSADQPSRVYVVSHQGDEGRAVIAPDWWSALGQVLREEGSLDMVRQVTARVAASGVVARCDDETWTVRRHHPQGTPDDTGIDAAADTRTACERALDAAMLTVPAESGAVLLVERGFLRFVAARGPHAPSLLGVRLPLTAGIAGFVVQTQRTLVIGDVHRHPRHDAALDRITGYETRQILGVPLADGGVVHGVMELMNPPQGARFGPEQRRRVEEVARVLSAFLSRRRSRRR